jgi:hypothetical protein
MVWRSYQHNLDHSHTWLVKVYGSDDPAVVKDSDPYVLDDRGLWFDGRETYATIEGLVLN